MQWRKPEPLVRKRRSIEGLQFVRVLVLVEVDLLMIYQPVTVKDKFEYTQKIRGECS